MSELLQRQRERLDELLVDRAVFGLDSAEEQEVDELLQRVPASDPDGWDRAAAALALVGVSGETVQLAPELSGKLAAGARAFFAERAPQPALAVAERPAPRRASSMAWWFAAAAALLAIVGWWPRDQQSSVADLLARAETLRVEAAGTDLARELRGDVIWSSDLQQGYLRLAGLPVNDPTVEQYQLWIVDGEQANPIDGGVFDSSTAGEHLIAIDAKLRVRQPKAFAITIEKPGGVVVSDQSRVAMLVTL